MKNKAIAVLLAIACLTCVSITARAELPAGTVIRHTINGIACDLPDGVIAPTINPRFIYFDTLSASISQSGGKATCTGTVSVDPDCTTTLTVTIQRSADDRNWSDLKSWSTKPTTGEKRIVLERQYYLMKGYSYRIVTSVAVNAGTQMETADCISNVVYY